MIGQHYTYKNHYPSTYEHFRKADYGNDKNDREKQTIAEYDNATLYNDYILESIIKHFEQKESIIIHLADHGEECYDVEHIKGRRHPAKLTPTIAKYEFEIPFWIWCSSLYKEKHPDIINSIKESINKRIMSDDLPHLLLYLAGIRSKYYINDHNIICTQYHNTRKRLLRGVEDYDSIMTNK